MEKVLYHEFPQLRRPLLIAGFEGWPNAAEVSSFSLQYLIDQLKAKPLASIPLGHFYDLSARRPIGIIVEGRLRELVLPRNDFYYAHLAPDRDLLLFSGVEPHFQWEAFSQLFLEVAQRFEAQPIITLGGTYDSIPHTFPTVVSAVFNSEALEEELLEAGLQFTEYTGPISIHTFLLEMARKRGIKALSLWGHAPQYLQARNVKVVHGLLQKLNRLIRAEIDLSKLANASHYFDQQVQHLVSQDPKLAEMIQRLEEAHVKTGRASVPPKKEEPKEDNVIYIQAFLKRQEEGEKNEN
ncbi:MAG: PAC2 family protein [Desulfobacterota bacterium]|nr:PAC2 family protein [Thermodesulfobacteriota bacterium]